MTLHPFIHLKISLVDFIILIEKTDRIGHTRTYTKTVNIFYGKIENINHYQGEELTSGRKNELVVYNIHTRTLGHVFPNRVYVVLRKVNGACTYNTSTVRTYVKIINQVDLIYREEIKGENLLRDRNLGQEVITFAVININTKDP